MLVTRHIPLNFEQNRSFEHAGSGSLRSLYGGNFTGIQDQMFELELGRLDHSGAFFVDWLSMWQEHHEDLPVVCSGVVIATDGDGCMQWQTIKAEVHEGSFETSVQVRCDGHKVTFSGNVSRFGRPDNLFGYSFSRCLEIVNGVLARFDLPPFTPGEKFYRTVKNEAGAKLVAAWTGAHVTRIDLTANYETGSLSNARAYMEWLASQQGNARLKVGTHGDGETVDWGRGSRNIYSKVYLKSAEIRRHGGDEKLIDHCESVGLVRFEVTVKSTMLHYLGCNHLGGLDMKQLELLFNEKAAVLTRAEHTHDDLENVKSRALRCTARDWLAGDDIQARMADSTFRRHRSQLLPYGIDIAVKRNVFEFKPRVRVIEVRPATMPAWYDFGERKAA